MAAYVGHFLLNTGDEREINLFSVVVLGLQEIFPVVLNRHKRCKSRRIEQGGCPRKEEEGFRGGKEEK